MPRLSITIDGSHIEDADLKSGVNRVGRSAANDVPITHPSISGHHCEIYLKETSIFVRDLGSTNGTFIDGQPIYESELLPGQSLMVGSVLLTVQRETSQVESAAAVATPPTRLGLRVAKIEPSTNSAPPVAPPPFTPAAARAYPYPKTSNLREKGFYRLIPESLLYPFKKDGWIAIICGTLVFLVLNFLGAFFFFIGIIGFGYLAAFMQKMIVSSAQGEEDLPQWPEFSDWYADIIHPALLLLGSFAASFGPAIAFYIYADVGPEMKNMVGLSLVMFGCFYLPLALIATAMYGSLAALNPLLIVPSMVRITKEYLVVCLLLGIMVGVRLGIQILVDLIPVPIVPSIIAGFFDLYFVIVEMRILGLLYFFKEDELSWSF